MKSKSQNLSDQVFKRVEHYLSDVPADKQRKYKGLCKRSGGMLRTMGLMQFLVYLEAKGQRDAEVQHNDLLEHLRESMEKLSQTQAQNTQQWIRAVRQMPLPSYMRSTREVLQLLYWHKQIADVMIQGNADFHGEDD